MSIQKTPLQTGKYYHIYNRGINSCDLFRENENYEYFMALYDKYISPVANTLFTGFGVGCEESFPSFG